MNIQLNPLWVSVIVTCVLVAITAYYANETRKIRLESIRPVFSLITPPSQYSPPRPNIAGLHLRNTGGIARELYVDVESSTGERQSLFVPSLDNSERIVLMNIERIWEEEGSVKVTLAFKDGYNKKRMDNLSIHLGEKEKRVFVFPLGNPCDYALRPTFK